MEESCNSGCFSERGWTRLQLAIWINYCVSHNYGRMVLLIRMPSKWIKSLSVVSVKIEDPRFGSDGVVKQISERVVWGRCSGKNSV